MKPPLFQLIVATHLAPLAPDLPLREPQMAANQSMLVLAFGAQNGIYFRASHDEGKTFSPTVKVADGEIVPLSRHRGPRIALAGNTIVITAVTGKKAAEGTHAHGLPSDGDLLVWRSTDGGKPWSPGVAINDVPGAPTEGLHSLASDGKDTLFATWSKDVPVYESPEGTICECCHPLVAIDAGGQVV